MKRATAADLVGLDPSALAFFERVQAEIDLAAHREPDELAHALDSNGFAASASALAFNARFGGLRHIGEDHIDPVPPHLEGVVTALSLGIATVFDPRSADARAEAFDTIDDHDARDAIRALTPIGFLYTGGWIALLMDADGRVFVLSPETGEPTQIAASGVEFLNDHARRAQRVR